MGRAEEFEAQGRTLEAILAYAEVFTAELDVALPTLDVATGLHEAGEVAAHVGDRDRAFVNYLAAARIMDELTLPRRCGDSLAAAGFTLADFRMWIPTDRRVDEDLVRIGFGGVLEEIRRVLLAAEPPTYQQPAPLHEKFAGIVILAGQASLDGPLVAFATALVDDLLRPFVERHGLVQQAEIDEPNELVTVALLFQELARFALCIGQQEEANRFGHIPSPDRVKLLAGSASQAFVGAQHERMVRWLGHYLRRRHGVPDVTDQELMATAAA